MKHAKFNDVYKLVDANMAVLLIGERGSGKTTLGMQIAEKLGLEFASMSMTRQTTLSHLLGFMNVNGVYISSQLRDAVEYGKLYLLDEIDAADCNVILCLNTIENGYVAFPDKIVKVHENFRLMATSNPQDNHRSYNGRAKLDEATLDRFDAVDIEIDSMLEENIVGSNVYMHMELIRKCLRETNSSTYVSLRDSMRFKKHKDLELLDGFVERLLRKDAIALENYVKAVNTMPKFTCIEDCKSLKDIWDHVMKQAITTED